MQQITDPQIKEAVDTLREAESMGYQGSHACLSAGGWAHWLVSGVFQDANRNHLLRDAIEAGEWLDNLRAGKGG